MESDAFTIVASATAGASMPAVDSNDTVSQVPQEQSRPAEDEASFAGTCAVCGAPPSGKQCMGCDTMLCELCVTTLSLMCNACHAEQIQKIYHLDGLVPGSSGSSPRTPLRTLVAAATPAELRARGAFRPIRQGDTAHEKEDADSSVAEPSKVPVPHTSPAKRSSSALFGALLAEDTTQSHSTGSERIASVEQPRGAEGNEDLTPVSTPAHCPTAPAPSPAVPTLSLTPPLESLTPPRTSPLTRLDGGGIDLSVTRSATASPANAAPGALMEPQIPPDGVMLAHAGSTGSSPNRSHDTGAGPAGASGMGTPPSSSPPLVSISTRASAARASAAADPSDGLLVLGLQETSGLSPPAHIKMMPPFISQLPLAEDSSEEEDAWANTGAAPHLFGGLPPRPATPPLARGQPSGSEECGVEATDGAQLQEEAAHRWAKEITQSPPVPRADVQEQELVPEEAPHAISWRAGPPAWTADAERETPRRAPDAGGTPRRAGKISAMTKLFEGEGGQGSPSQTSWQSNSGRPLDKSGVAQLAPGGLKTLGKLAGGSPDARPSRPSEGRKWTVTRGEGVVGSNGIGWPAATPKDSLMAQGKAPFIPSVGEGSNNHAASSMQKEDSTGAAILGLQEEFSAPRLQVGDDDSFEEVQGGNDAAGAGAGWAVAETDQIFHDFLGMMDRQLAEFKARWSGGGAASADDGGGKAGADSVADAEESHSVALENHNRGPLVADAELQGADVPPLPTSVAEGASTVLTRSSAGSWGGWGGALRGILAHGRRKGEGRPEDASRRPREQARARLGSATVRFGLNPPEMLISPRPLREGEGAGLPVALGMGLAGGFSRMALTPSHVARGSVVLSDASHSAQGAGSSSQFSRLATRDGSYHTGTGHSGLGHSGLSLGALAGASSRGSGGSVAGGGGSGMGSSGSSSDWETRWGPGKQQWGQGPRALPGGLASAACAQDWPPPMHKVGTWSAPGRAATPSGEGFVSNVGTGQVVTEC